MANGKKGTDAPLPTRFAVGALLVTGVCACGRIGFETLDVQGGNATAGAGADGGDTTGVGGSGEGGSAQGQTGGASAVSGTAGSGAQDAAAGSAGTGGGTGQGAAAGAPGSGGGSGAVSQAGAAGESPGGAGGGGGVSGSAGAGGGGGSGDPCAFTPCGANASCVAPAGVPGCVCDFGYSGDGYTCTDLDECALGTGNCDPLATCTNTPGSFTCNCPAGYDDVNGDGTLCGDLGPFEPPVLVAAISDPAGEGDPSFTDDGLELYFTSTRAGGPGWGDIWVSTRTTTSDPWGPPSLVAEVSSSDIEMTPGVSPDGLNLWFASARPGCVGGSDIWFSARDSRTEAWSAPVCVSELNSTAGEYAPAVTSSLLQVVISSDRPGGVGGRDLYLATRASTSDPWGTPAFIPVVNSPQDDSGRLVASGRQLFLDSDRTGSELTDLYLATRTQISEPFTTPQPLAELNSSRTDADPWVSQDGHYIMFASDRTGDFELYEARR